MSESDTEVSEGALERIRVVLCCVQKWNQLRPKGALLSVAHTIDPGKLQSQSRTIDGF